MKSEADGEWIIAKIARLKHGTWVRVDYRVQVAARREAVS